MAVAAVVGLGFVSAHAEDHLGPQVSSPEKTLSPCRRGSPAVLFCGEYLE
jgi:hypothetical protein